jgi:Tfp pilus assembly protein PilO
MELNEQQKRMLLIVVFVGFIGLVTTAYLWYIWGSGIVKTSRQKVETAATETASIEAELTKINEFQALTQSEYSVIEAKLERMTRRLPPSPEAPGFLKALSNILRETGIDTKDLAPQAVEAFGGYTEIPYQISARGRFHEIGQFLNLLEQNPDRFMRVKEMTVKNSEDRPSLHPVDVKIATFMFADKSAEVADAQPAGQTPAKP